jgi:hypothetical protein
MLEFDCRKEIFFTAIVQKSEQGGKMFKVKIKKSKLTVTEKEPLTSGASRIYDVAFEFDSEWDAIEHKIAVFKADDAVIDVILGEENICEIPHEVLSREHAGKSLWVGVYGTAGDGVILPTVWNVLEVIHEGAELGEAGSESMSAAVQVLYQTAEEAKALLSEATEKSENLIQYAVSAKESEENARDSMENSIRYCVNAETEARKAANAAVSASEWAEKSENVAKGVLSTNENLIAGFRAEGKRIAVPENAYPYARLMSVEGSSYSEGNRLLPSGFSVSSAGQTVDIPDEIKALPDYGHGAGEGYNNVVDFANKKYIRRCKVVEVESPFVYYDFLFIGSLRIDFPENCYTEWVSAIETIKCSHSGLTFHYVQVITEYGEVQGCLVVALDGRVPTEEEFTAFLNEQKAAGTPVMVAYGIPNAIETDISDIIDGDIRFSAEAGGEIVFDGNGGSAELFLPKDIADKNCVNLAVKAMRGETANAIKETLIGATISADDVSPNESELYVKVYSKNLIPNVKRNYMSGTPAQYFYTYMNYDGSIQLSGTVTSEAYYYPFDITGINFIPDMTYTISGGKFFLAYYNENDEYCVVGNSSGAAKSFVWREGYRADSFYLLLSVGDVYSDTLYPKIELGTTATSFTAYVDPDGAVVTLTDDSGEQSAAAGKDGRVCGLVPHSSHISLKCQRTGILLLCKYNRDLMKVIENLTNAIISLGGNV